MVAETKAAAMEDAARKLGMEPAGGRAVATVEMLVVALVVATVAADVMG